MNEVASSSRLSEAKMPLGVCDTGGGDGTLKSVPGSGSTSIDGVDAGEDRSLLLFAILVRFITNNLIRSCCSREAPPVTIGPEVEVGDRLSRVEVSSLEESVLPLQFVISGVELGHLSEGGDPVGVGSCWISGESERREGDRALVREFDDTDGEGEVGGRDGVRPDPSTDSSADWSTGPDLCRCSRSTVAKRIVAKGDSGLEVDVGAVEDRTGRSRSSTSRSGCGREDPLPLPFD